MTHSENTVFVRRILTQRMDDAYVEQQRAIVQRDAIQVEADRLSTEVSVLASALEVLQADAGIEDTK